MENITAKILLEPLLQRAEKEGKWLRCTYQGIEFSPKELREENANGHFCWGPVNWFLFDPKEKLRDPEEEAEKVRQRTIKNNEDIKKRMQS